ncbi:type I polyketide synthase [Streptomyces violaceusniger]|uniref:type I polyketide synthase n=1 Tax=Streptomyces violaceusniger TaxID=68280 RepID=UPI00099897E5|nr:type I polyketide synthase [Streptomyces violaceusniger]
MTERQGASDDGRSDTWLWTLEADGPTALRDQVGILLDFASKSPGLSPAEVGAALSRRLSSSRRPATLSSRRAAVTGRQLSELRAGLTALASGRGAVGLVHGRPTSGRTAFVFPGQGPQWPGMAAELTTRSRTFRTTMDDCAAALEPYLDWPLLDALSPDSGLPLDRADVAQPALFAVMISLAATWRSCGVEPDAVMGYSIGEIAAAAVSGVLTLDDAARVVTSWGHAEATLTGRGGMLSVMAPVADIRSRLASYDGEVTIAAVNSPRSVVVAGELDALQELQTRLTAEGTVVKRVAMDLSAHSPQIDQLRQAIQRDLISIRPERGRIPLYSSFSGGRVEDTSLLDGNHWFEVLRGVMDFRAAVEAAVSDGHSLFVETSPHPVLTSALQENFQDGGVDAIAVGSLRRDEGGPARFLASLGSAFVAGATIDVGELTRDPVEPISLPDLGSPPPSDSGRDTVRTELNGLGPSARRRALADLICHEVVNRAASTEPMDPRREFRDAGIDSATGLDLVNSIAKNLEVPLAATALFDHPTPQLLARHIDLELWGQDGPQGGRLGRRSGTDDRDDPVVIVGMACRLPGGVSGPQDLWRLLVEGVDATTDFPAGRGWERQDRHGAVRRGPWRGGFLTGADRFDAGFFHISPREALAMDPQQRLSLETAWETIERAGIDAHGLRGTRTGVFIGAMPADYGPPLDAGSDMAGHLLTGTTTSMLSGRVAYTLGLEGAALTVDTACSSSLVALHLAAQALRSGECDLALAGGVTVLSTPGMFAEFDKQGALAPDGRSKAFSAQADGFGLAEGIGMVLVERLSHARQHGHDVLAVLRGSAVNSDGAANGLTAPNGTSQRNLIRQALAGARLRPGDVDVVEAHGTGTRLGDPIEANALLAAYGDRRDHDRPLLVGSMKSNIGHTQAAAGLSGVIKMVLAMRHGLVPRTLHVDQPSPHVDWQAGGLELVTHRQAWPGTGRPRRAGVSAFGISGTNAHVILEQAPEDASLRPQAPATTYGPVAIPVTAASESALRAQAARLLGCLDSADQAQEDIHVVLGHSLATGRAALDRRAVIVADDASDLRDALTALGNGGPHARLVTGDATIAGHTAFVLPGQGSQRLGMGRELYEADAAFAEALDEVCAELDRHLPQPLRTVMWAEPGSREAALLDSTLYAQPALFAVEAALVRLFERWGVVPDYLIGHSLGEISAAYVAGVLTLADAASVVTTRSALMHELPPGGAMFAVQAEEHDVLARLAEYQGAVTVAAVNGPSSVVVSGDERATADLARRFAERGVITRRLQVGHAFHSGHMDPMLDKFHTAVGRVVLGAPRIRMVSNLDGQVVSADRIRTPDYWTEHVRRPVRFHDGIRTLMESGVTTFIELGPGAALTASVRDILGAGGDSARRGSAAAVATLRRGHLETRSVLTAVAVAQTRGAEVDWPAVYAPARPAVLDLPTYPFEGDRYWLMRDRAQERPPEREETTVDGWRYRIEWEPASPVEDPGERGAWLVVLPGGDEHRELAGLCRQLLGEDFADARILRLDEAPADRATLAAMLDQQAADLGRPVTGVLSLLALDPAGRGSRAGLGPGLTTLVLAQALADAALPAPLRLVTRCAVKTGHGDERIDPLQARIWGFGRSVAAEHPDLVAGLIDLPAASTPVDPSWLRQALNGYGNEDQLAIRPEGVRAPRLVPAPVRASVPERGQPTGTALVLGGTGALGSHVARELAKTGVDRLVLLSRRGPRAPGAARQIAELEELGVSAHAVACDMASEEDLAAVVRQEQQAYGPIRTVVHAAGSDRHASLTDCTTAGFAEIHDKAAAAAQLDRIFQDEPVEFVLFSSMTAVLGGPGRHAQASADAFIDAVAERRRERGLPAISLEWGTWEGPGMGGAAEDADRPRRDGVRPMAADRALSALRRSMAGDDGVLLIADVDWSRFVPANSAARHRPMLSRLHGSATFSGPHGSAPKVGERSSGTSEPQSGSHAMVRTHVAAVLGFPDPGDIDPDRSFRDLGLDSMGSVDLCLQLSEATGIELPITVVFDHSTPAALAEHLVSLQASPPHEPDLLEAALAAASEMVLDDERRDRVAAWLRDLSDRLRIDVKGASPLDMRGGSPLDANGESRSAANSDANPDSQLDAKSLTDAELFKAVDELTS